MTAEPPQGVPYAGGSDLAIDDWSRRIFEALADWPVAREGVWTRWEPGYLLLEISSVEREPIDRLAIWTADDELSVAFGFWEDNYPWPGEPTDPAHAVAKLKQQVGDWLSGRVKTMVVTDASGKWCGTRLLEGGEILPQVKAAAHWVAHGNPAQVEVRAPAPCDWQVYRVEPEWLVPPPTVPEGNR